MKRHLLNKKRSSIAGVIFLFLATSACSHSFLKYDKEATLEKNDEFAQVVKIEKAPEAVENTESGANAPAAPSAEVKPVPAKKAPKAAVKPKKEAKKAEKKKGKTVKVEAPPLPLVRQPELEDNEGFGPGSRRPLVDPYRVGEVVTHNVSYFKISAGELKLKVEPYAQVNGKKSYTFAIEIQSSSTFAAFYSAQDRVETLVDFDQLIPRTFALHVKESGQLREARSFFDFEKNQATYWEKKVTKKSGEEEKKQQWEILPYTQNVFSALFYMRIFKWEIGKEYAFHVADDEKNLIFKGKAIRKEKLDTALGEMNAIVVKPEIILKGAFTPVGDIYIWLSDDEHKYILRIESKIKIGTLVSEVTSIVPGKP